MEDPAYALAEWKRADGKRHPPASTELKPVSVAAPHQEIASMPVMMSMASFVAWSYPSPPARKSAAPSLL